MIALSEFEKNQAETFQQFTLINDVETLKALAPFNLRLIDIQNLYFVDQNQKDLVLKALADTEWLENLLTPIVENLKPRTYNVYDGDFPLLKRVASFSPKLSLKVKNYLFVNMLKNQTLFTNSSTYLEHKENCRYLMLNQNRIREQSRYEKKIIYT